MTDKKIKRPQLVFTLLVEVGRNPNDGLPKGATDKVNTNCGRFIFLSVI